MILRPSFSLSMSVAALAALGACAGGPLEPTPPAVTSASYVCNDGSRIEARFVQTPREILVVGGDLEGRRVPMPRNTLELIPEQGAPLRLSQGPAATSTGFYYQAAGYSFVGEGAAATLNTPAGSVRCQAG